MVAPRRNQPTRKPSSKSASSKRPPAKSSARKGAQTKKAAGAGPEAKKGLTKAKPSKAKGSPGPASKKANPIPAPSAPKSPAKRVPKTVAPLGDSRPAPKPASKVAAHETAATPSAPVAADLRETAKLNTTPPSGMPASDSQSSAPKVAPAAEATPPPALPAAPPPPPPPRRPLVTLTLVTRKSPLAVAQADLVLARFTERIPTYAFRVLKLVTTGDRQAEWSLEEQGGKGLFTGELEQALADHRADVAVHSAKDLPTDMPNGLALAGFLPREDPRDVLVVRQEIARPATIATGSPRRRMQLERQFTKATFLEIRGNVDTRLRKIAEERIADATVLAAAGLKRLGITEWPGLRFQPLPLAVSVPAVGQAAIAVQARGETANFLRSHLDEPTRVAVELERAFLRLMGGGCHTAFAVHYDGIGAHLFHETCGYQRFTIVLEEAIEPARVAERILRQLKLKP